MDIGIAPRTLNVYDMTNPDFFEFNDEETNQILSQLRGGTAEIRIGDGLVPDREVLFNEKDEEDEFEMEYPMDALKDPKRNKKYDFILYKDKRYPIRMYNTNESHNFERGQDPKKSMNVGLYAELEEILENEDNLRDYLVDIDNALHSATEIYLPNDKARELVKMWWEDSHGIKNWEFKSITEDEEDEEVLNDYIPLKVQIDRNKRQGWKVLWEEDNFGLKEVILYKRGTVNESVRFERTSNPKKGMGLGKYAPQIITVPDWDGDPMKIKIQDNEFTINDYHIRVEFEEKDEYGDGELEKSAKVYVDGQESGMNVFLMKPAEYEFTVPEKPSVEIDGKYQKDPNPDNWSKTQSAYGYPLVDEDDKERLEEIREKYGYWIAMSGDVDRSAKNPFAAVAKLFMAIY